MTNNLVTEELFHFRQMFLLEGHDIRFVGGCVRDFAVHLEPKDIDLCTDATPEEQIAIYKHNGVDYYETGLQHGTLTVKLDGNTYEVTTLRRDVETDGRHATVEFTSDWEADLARRDLTINAMMMTFEGEIIDPFGGLSDLDRWNVRFVGDAETRIKEDYLRILRYFRFLARFGSGVHPPYNSAAQAIRAHGAGLRTISKERIWMEMSKIISGPRAPETIEHMFVSGVTYHIGLSRMNLERLRQVGKFTTDPVTRMVALTYYKGEHPGLEYGLHPVFTEWKMSGEEIGLARFLTRHGFKSRTTKDYRRMQVLEGATTMEVVRLAQLNREPAEEIIFMSKWEPPVCPINGNDLKPYASGRPLGDLLKRLKSDWFESDFALTKDQLLAGLPKKVPGEIA